MPNASPNHLHDYGEIRFFFHFNVLHQECTLALVFMYSGIDKKLFEDSHKTLAVCQYLGDSGLAVVNAKAIISVVSMQPLPMTCEEAAAANAKEHYGNRWFVCKRPGLDVAQFASVVSVDVDEE